MRTLIPSVLVGYLLLHIRYRYAYGTKATRKVTGIAYAAYLIGSLAFIATYIPATVPILAFFVMLAAIILVNHKFYIFLGRHMGWLTACSAVPFHVLFYFYNGLAFLTGIVAYATRSVRPRRHKAIGRAVADQR